MLEFMVGSKQVKVQDGWILREGEVVGRVTKDLKFGYHPCAKVQVLSLPVEWVELDKLNDEAVGLQAAISKALEN